MPNPAQTLHSTLFPQVKSTKYKGSFPAQTLHSTLFPQVKSTKYKGSFPQVRPALVTRHL